jgi:hypothetical protein
VIPLKTQGLQADRCSVPGCLRPAGAALLPAAISGAQGQPGDDGLGVTAWVFRRPADNLACRVFTEHPLGDHCERKEEAVLCVCMGALQPYLRHPWVLLELKGPRVVPTCSPPQVINTGSRSPERDMVSLVLCRGDLVGEAEDGSGGYTGVCGLEFRGVCPGVGTAEPRTPFVPFPESPSPLRLVLAQLTTACKEFTV